MRSFLNKFLAHRNGILVSKRDYEELQLQKINLLRESADFYRQGLDQTQAVGIVFSFNRPVQVFALLESYFLHAKNPAPLIVQYGCGNEAAKRGYLAAKDLMVGKPVTFVEETTCRETLLEILGEQTAGKVFFLVDDIVFTRPVDMAQFTGIDPMRYVPSLRMGPHLNYSYTCQMPQPAPELEKSKDHPEMLSWTWGAEGNEWSYPMSVDGHLFDMAEIVMMSRSAPFKAPNTYEGLLHGFKQVVWQRPGLCYPQAVLFNNPCNKVQSENDNVAGLGERLTPARMLEHWEQGQKIDVQALTGFENTAPHQEVAFGFVAR